MQPKRILLAGEPMALFLAETTGPLEEVQRWSCAIAGAEYNVAVGLTRLGHQVDYLTRLGKDPFGRRIAAALKAEGIGTRQLLWSDTLRTGFMLKGLTAAGDPEIFYYRAGSAASTLCCADIDRVNLTEYDHVHLTGITPALSAECREAMLYLAGKAHQAGLTVSLDPNLRPQLWPDEQTMTTCIHRLAGLCDLFLPGAGEAARLLKADGISPETPEASATAVTEAAAAFAAAAAYRKQGVPCVVVKSGPAGAVWAAGEEQGFVPGYPVSQVVDTVGAGDGFAVGVLSARLEGLDWPACVARGNAIGAIQVMNRGDNEGLPTRQQLEAFLAAQR